MTLRWSDGLLILTLAGTTAQGQTLELCEQLLAPPQGASALSLGRYKAQLVQLQDQLRAIPYPDELLANCHHKVSRALARYSGKVERPLPLISAEAAYLTMTQDNRRTIQINRKACLRQDVEGEQARTLTLSKRSVGRYLFQAADSGCARSVWLAWQNRGGQQADRHLDTILALSHHQARERGYDDVMAWKLDGAFLGSYQQVDRFLSGLNPESAKLPWKRPNTPRYSYVDPHQLALATLEQLAQLFGLSLAPLPGDHWQLWDGRRYLGTLSLAPAERSGYLGLQRNLVNYYPGIGQVHYRNKVRWRGEHLSELAGSITTAFYHLAGHQLENYLGQRQEPDLVSLPRAIGLALGATPAFTSALGKAPEAEPLGFGPGELLRTRLSLAFWHQSNHQPQELARQQQQLFRRYYGVDAPKGWRPLSAYPKLVEQGPMLYGHLLAKKTAMDLVDLWRSDRISGPQLWEEMFVNSNHQAYSPSLARLTQSGN
ncbi:hypothetical protein [Ferrimonas sp. YFM]|uniref:hypothetical protein n=1 Tax=Ferrimonas sp. YFM TaxID=3028878 RepID=UPI00257391C7|nr:hypothetical protein [Ferrimonas sp. YFM]BDY04827.1 hypothetical protein F0521_18680 [Ferrimonas sp. YFM]